MRPTKRCEALFRKSKRRGLQRCKRVFTSDGVRRYCHIHEWMAKRDRAVVFITDAKAPDAGA